MKILITGATSGIGRQLAEDYHLDNHEVWAVDAMKKPSRISPAGDCISAVWISLIETAASPGLQASTV